MIGLSSVTVIAAGFPVGKEPKYPLGKTPRQSHFQLDSWNNVDIFFYIYNVATMKFFIDNDSKEYKNVEENKINL